MIENVRFETNAVRSTASVAGHPIHPMIVPFPIAFFVGALACDLAFWGTYDPFWARAAHWLIGAGIIMAGAAALFGLIDFTTIRRARERIEGWAHMLGNVLVVILEIINWAFRLSRDPGAVIPAGLVLSIIVTLLLVVTGWLGGELAFRHLIGVSGAVCTHEPVLKTTGS